MTRWTCSLLTDDFGFTSDAPGGPQRPVLDGDQGTCRPAHARARAGDCSNDYGHCCAPAVPLTQKTTEAVKWNLQNRQSIVNQSPGDWRMCAPLVADTARPRPPGHVCRRFAAVTAPTRAGWTPRSARWHCRP